MFIGLNIIGLKYDSSNREEGMTLLARNFIVSAALAFSDLLSFTISLYIALAILTNKSER